MIKNINDVIYEVKCLNCESCYAREIERCFEKNDVSALVWRHHLQT